MIKISRNQTKNMKGNVHVANVEYGLYVVYRYKIHIHYSDNKMNGCFQLSTQSTTPEAVLLSNF